MKNILSITLSFLLTFSIAIAQDGINYQGAATDANGDELTNQSISIRASVLSTSANGNLEWEETHSTTTDQFGLFNIVIGQGSSTSNGATATFDDMDWGSGNHFLKIEMDASGGTNYAMIGTTQMMSVPYALYAKSAGIDSAMLANMISASGLDSAAIADMIENVIGDSPYYEGSSNQNSNITNDSLINGYRYFYTYVFDNKSRLFETDSTQSFANELYSVPGGSSGDVFIDNLYIDEVNQELYFLTSPYGTAGGTNLMKTSLLNFNPQLVYVIPGQMNYIHDFDIHPITGDFYWCYNYGHASGVYYYQISSNQVTKITGTNNGNYYATCFNSNGDLFYTIGSSLYDSGGNTIYSGGSTIQEVKYYAPTNSFIIATSSQIVDDQNNVLFTSPPGGGTIYALDINYTTQRILFNTNMVTMSMDINGGNLNYNGVYPARIESITAIE